MLVPAFKETKNDMMPGVAEREAFDDVLKKVEEGTWHDKEVVLQTICDYFSLARHTKPADAMAALKVIAVVDKTPTKIKLAKNESDACFSILKNVHVDGVCKKATLKMLEGKMDKEENEEEHTDITRGFAGYMLDVYYTDLNECRMLAPEFSSLCIHVSKKGAEEGRDYIVDKLVDILGAHPGQYTDIESDRKYFVPAMRSFDKDESPIIRRKARASIADFEMRYRKETSAKQMMQPT